MRWYEYYLFANVDFSNMFGNSPSRSCMKSGSHRKYLIYVGRQANTQQDKYSSKTLQGDWIQLWQIAL